MAACDVAIWYRTKRIASSLDPEVDVTPRILRSVKRTKLVHVYVVIMLEWAGGITGTPVLFQNYSFPGKTDTASALNCW